MYKPDYLTLQDIASATVDGKVQHIASEFLTGLTLFYDAPWRQATSTKYDEGTFYAEEDKADCTYRALGEGYTPSKSSYYKRIVNLGQVSKMVQFNQDIVRIKEEESKYFMTKETDRMLKKLGMNTEFSLLYISQNVDPSAPEGLLPKYSVLTNLDGEIINKSTGTGTGVKTPYVCLDALGAKTDTTRDGKLSSVLVVYLDDLEGVCLLYPHGSKTIGFDFRKDDQFNWGYDKNGKKIRELNATCDIFCGITLNNSLACTRIANVDPEDETSVKTMMNLLFSAYGRMEDHMKKSVRIYTTGQVVSAVRRLQYNNVYHSTLSGIQALNLSGEVVVDNDVFTVCNSMLYTEGRIEGITA